MPPFSPTIALANHIIAAPLAICDRCSSPEEPRRRAILLAGGVIPALPAAPEKLALNVRTNNSEPLFGHFIWP